MIYFVTLHVTFQAIRLACWEHKDLTVPTSTLKIVSRNNAFSNKKHKMWEKIRHFISFHFIFFIHGNPVGKGRFSGGRDENLKSKIYK